MAKWSRYFTRNSLYTIELTSIACNLMLTEIYDKVELPT